MSRFESLNLKYTFGKVWLNYIMIEPSRIFEDLKVNDYVICIETESYFAFLKKYIRLLEIRNNINRIINSDMADDLIIKELKEEITNLNLIT